MLKSVHGGTKACAEGLSSSRLVLSMRSTGPGLEFRV